MNAVSIRNAAESDLTALHDLAGRALRLDSFSRELLREKLFHHVRPNEFTWACYIAEDAGRPVGLMQSVARRAAKKAWIGVFAVEAAHRRRGVARALYEHTCRAWPSDVEEVEVLTIPGNYFLPGVDPRYTEAVCFLQRLGFERFSDCVNLTADLSRRFDASADAARLKKQGVEVRRARRAADDPLLDAFFGEHFGEDWRFEASLAMNNDPPALHLALKEGGIIAFSAHSSQNREWGFFGPMGTAPDARGLGLGRVLLWRCLNDMRDAGHKTSVIPWVGPIAFYQQWCGARVERVFWRYKLKLTGD